MKPAPGRGSGGSGSCGDSQRRKVKKAVLGYGNPYRFIHREFENIGGVVHTHSTWATIWSQLGRKIPPCGATHADYFYGDIPCTRKMSVEEIHRDYEQETGLVIAETMAGMNPQHCPAVLVNDHGPFSWGNTGNGSAQRSRSRGSGKDGLLHGTYAAEKQHGQSFNE